MNQRRYFIQEVIQTSALDCGPACLNALLNGFGIYAGYGRLREACQTGLDGTSIDTIENLANRLGLDTEQIVVPADHIPHAEANALPAMTVVQLPNGITHFVVVWRRHGGRLQIMDPASGRRWTPLEEFAKELYIHEMSVPAAGWREWAQTEEFSGALKARILSLGLTEIEATAAVNGATVEPSWQVMATLDAAVRMFEALAASGALTDRTKVYALLVATVQKALATPDDIYRVIPQQYWSVRPGNEDQLVVRGAVLVRVKGRSAAQIDLQALPAEVAVAMTERAPEPAAALWRFLKQDGGLTPAMVSLALFVSCIGVVIQALLFRSLIGGGGDLSDRAQRMGALSALVFLLVILVAIEVPALTALAGMGRRLETRFRRAFLIKLPRIADQYFHSRLTSDMAERSHSVQNIRALPVLGAQLLRALFQLLLTTAAVIWIDPVIAPLAILSALLAVALPIAAQPLLGEREMRVRTHAGALSRFYLDALLGLIPIRTHVGDAVVRGEHRTLLTKWVRAGLETQKIAIVLEGVQMFTGFGLAALLTIVHVWRHPESPALLLLAYWALMIPSIGQELAGLATSYPLHRNIALRLLEPLGALENQTGEEPAAVAQTDHTGGAALRLQDVSMLAGGHPVLHDIHLDIPAGSHVAIVGSSGAGKSSLLGLLLGWHKPSSGTIEVDNVALDESAIERLRRETAWIDPTIQIWNRAFVDNLRFGMPGEAAMPFGEAVDEAELAGVLEKLPDGLQTKLGDGGALVSGGEGQRVRIGRALLRSGVRLALLDEPFRGLDADMRQKLLLRVRRIWEHSTLLFVTHDVADTQFFERVLVVENGTIVEDGRPQELAKTPESRYATLLRGEVELKRHLLEGAAWRRLEMHRGLVSENGGEGAGVRTMPSATATERIA